MKTVFGWLLGWVLTAAVLCGQSLPEWLAKEDIPAPPALGVRDEAGLFSRDDEALARITDEVRALEKKHGFRIYLVVESVLIGGTAHELAAGLQESWLADDDGLVVVYEADSRRLGLGRGMEKPDALPGADGRVPSYIMVDVLSRVQRTVDTNVPPQAFLEMLVTSLAREFDAYFTRRNEPPPVGLKMRYGLLAAGGAALLALGGLMLAWAGRRSSPEAAGILKFPEVEQPERLGAPFGAEVLSVRRFASPRRQRSS